MFVDIAVSRAKTLSFSICYRANYTQGKTKGC